jgi:hypothetical protein
MEQERIMGSPKNGSADSFSYASKSFLSIHLILANGARNGLCARRGDPKPCDLGAIRFKQHFKPAIPPSAERLKTKAK